MSLDSLLFLLIYISAAVSAWLATYAVHSTVILGGMWLLQRMAQLSRLQQDVLWKLSLLAGVVTPTVSLVAGVIPLGGRYETAAVVEASWSVAPSTSAWLRVLPLLVVCAWLLYAAAVAGRVIWTTLRARRALGPRVPADAATCALMASVARQMGVERPVRVTVSDVLSSPAVLGRTEITLPRRVLTDFAAEEQRSIAAHELAHVLRNDPWWLTVATTIESLFFFQPLNRMARRKWQDAAEYMCDEMAVRTAGARLPLARALARVAEWPRGGAAAVLAPALAEQSSTLLSRVRSILDHDESAHPAPTRGWLPASLILVAVALGCAPAFGPGTVRGWGTPVFHWAGIVAPGQTMEVQGMLGSIRAVPARGDSVVVRATRHGHAPAPDIRFDVVTTTAGVTICALYPTPASVPPNRCVPGASGQHNTRANDVEVEFIVHVPVGVGFTASSATGHITTGPLSGPITAQTSSGNIDVAMTRTDWIGPAALLSKAGNVRVRLPRDADVVITAETRTGTIRSAFDIGAQRSSRLRRLAPRGSLGGAARGVVGQGGRELLLSTIAGNIVITTN